MESVAFEPAIPAMSMACNADFWRTLTSDDVTVYNRYGRKILPSRPRLGGVHGGFLDGAGWWRLVTNLDKLKPYCWQRHHTGVQALNWWSCLALVERVWETSRYSSALLLCHFYSYGTSSVLDSRVFYMIEAGRKTDAFSSFIRGFDDRRHAFVKGIRSANTALSHQLNFRSLDGRA